MKQLFKYLIPVVALAATPAMLWAQKSDTQLTPDSKKAPAVFFLKDTVTTSYLESNQIVKVAANCDYKLTPEFPEGTTPWFTAKQQTKGRVVLSNAYGYNSESRFAKLNFELPDGNKKALVVQQTPNQAAGTLQGDFKLTIKSATGEQAQSGFGIDKTYDGDYASHYHSSWSTSGPTVFPVNLTYTLNTEELDYLIYTPRQDGGGNGNFGRVTIYYSTQDAPNSFTQIKDLDFGESGSASMVSFAEPLKNVAKVKFSVHSGTSNYASCGEMEFFQKNKEENALFARYFSDPLCTKLRSDLTEDDLAAISHPFVKALVACAQDASYSKKYRVGTFEAYEPIGTLSTRLKTSTYNRYENPTGIYFEENAPIAIFVDGLGDASATLIIKNFGQAYEGEPQSESFYALSDGLNVITPKNRGNGYISYYTPQYLTAPNVKMHFVMAKETGYFDLERGDTDEYWQELLANNVSDILDIRTKRFQGAFPIDRLKVKTPVKGRQLAQNYENLVVREWEIMGLKRYGIEPKNRMFARVVWGGFMHADGVGAAAHHNSIDGWIQADMGDGEWWGLAHELGHVNQVRPGVKWLGTSEVTNNIYSAWVQFTLGKGWLRLESEKTGVSDFSGLSGGRFNAHLENGVRKGQQWLLQVGPDKQDDSEAKEVEKVDYDGNPTGEKVTLKARGGDFFVRLVPMWQLQLYCHQAGYSPDVYAKVCEAVRNMDDSKMTNGQLQLNFMKLVCDSTGMNFLPFFEKAGMLKPIAEYIADYSGGWMMISQEMIDNLKAYVADKGYETPKGAINYISGYNWQVYKDQLPVEGVKNIGCSTTTGGRIKVDHSKWKNVVAYHTYNADGELLRITMAGLGGTEGKNDFTQVLWPNSSSEKAAYITAVAWDGTETECYRP